MTNSAATRSALLLLLAWTIPACRPDSVPPPEPAPPPVGVPQARSGTLLWETIEPPPGSSWGQDLSAARNGDLLAAGYVDPEGTGRSDALVRRLGSDGSPKWTKILGGARRDQASSVVEAASGDVIAAGSTRSAGTTRDEDGWIARFDAEGERRWERIMGGSGSDQFYAVRELGDGRLAAIGLSSTESAGAEDLWLAVTDAEGQLSWERRLGGERSDWGYGVAENGSGIVAVGATASTERGDFQAWILGLDGEGELLWEQRLGGPGPDELIGLVSLGDRGFVAAGYTTPGPELRTQIWLVAFTAEGEITWDRSYGGPRDDMAMALAPVPTGGFLLAGGTTPEGTTRPDAWLLAVDERGDVLWQDRRGGTLPDVWQGVAARPDGGAVVAGYRTREDEERPSLWIGALAPPETTAP